MRRQKRNEDIEEQLLNSFTLRHSKSIAFCGIEAFHATLFHVIETVKVRGMARNLTQDVSYYF